MNTSSQAGTPSHDHRILTQSLAALDTSAGSFARRFYKHLLETNPELVPLFAKVSMEHQEQKLMQAVGAAINAFDNWNAIQPALREMGARHRNYGVAHAHYDAVGASLLATLSVMLAPETWQEAKPSWEKLYERIRLSMGEDVR